MSRTAEYTIKGFIYQFLVTLSKVLDTPDGEITVEGVIEDVDVVTPTVTTAYQCKYHETKNKFTLSAIYKPILQMLCHFKNNQTSLIQYRLHAHFPNETVGSTKRVTQIELSEVLSSTAQGLQSYIKELNGFTNTTTFLSRFEIMFGSSYDDLESSVIVALSKEGLTTEDVKDIFYPTAVHRIAELSIKTDVNERKIRKSEFIRELTFTKKTAVSRWTKELQSYNNILKKRREQLRADLNKNHRKRCIIVDSNYLVEFDSRIVQFIESFIDKYNSKIRLNLCPTFSLKCAEPTINVIWKALDARSIKVERGYKAGEIDISHFLREPIKAVRENVSEFNVRICNHDNDFGQIAAKAKFDDVYVIAPAIPDELKTLAHINIEHLETNSIKEIEYLLSLKTSL